MISKELIELFEDSQIEYKLNDTVTSTFRIGGRVALSLYPNSAEQLIACLDALNEENVKFHVLGNLSNLLLAFDFFDGAMIFTQKMTDMAIDGKCIRAAAGVQLSQLSSRAYAFGLTGLEFAYGIPGRVGGAVYMNAGAYGSAVSEVLESSTAYDIDNKKIMVIDGSKHGFGYRKSIYMENPKLICLEAVFALNTCDKEQIKAKMDANMVCRKEKQPLEYGSAGSYFKRPEGHFAGKLIEDAGLKGLTVGGAQVSKKHAGFIVNIGGATAADVLELEEKIKERVMSLFGVMLEREVELIK